jgi:hypothetical protein
MSLQSSGLSEEKRAKLEAEIVQKQSLVEEHLFDLLDIDHLYKETEELFQAAEAKSQEEEDHRTALNDLEEKKQAKTKELESEREFLRTIISTIDVLTNIRLPLRSSTVISVSALPKVKLPADLPKLKPGANVEQTLNEIKAKLQTHQIDERCWFLALGAVTKGATLLWVQRNILDSPKTWDEATALYTREYATLNQGLQAFNDLQAQKQGTMSGAEFMRTIDSLIAIAGSDSLGQDGKNSPLLISRLISNLNEEYSTAIGFQVRQPTTLKYEDLRGFLQGIDQMMSLQRARRSSSSQSSSQSSTSSIPETISHERKQNKYNNKKLKDHKNARAPETRERDLSTVTCHKCKETGHYANRCPLSAVQQNKKLITAIMRAVQSDDGQRLSDQQMEEIMEQIESETP